MRTSDNDQKTTSSNQNIDRPDVLCARGLVAQNRSTRCPIPKGGMLRRIQCCHLSMGIAVQVNHPLASKS